MSWLRTAWAWLQRWGAMVAAAAAALLWVLYSRERRARIAAENRAAVQQELAESMAATHRAAVVIATKRRKALLRIERELEARREMRKTERKAIEERIRVINETDDLDELAALVNAP